MALRHPTETTNPLGCACRATPQPPTPQARSRSRHTRKRAFAPLRTARVRGGRLEVIDLTKDQKPEDIEETKREIEEALSRIDRMQQTQKDLTEEGPR